MQKYCTRCKSLIPEKSKYCVVCGTKFNMINKVEPIQSSSHDESQSTKPSSLPIVQIKKHSESKSNKSFKPKSKSLKKAGVIVIIALLLIAVFYTGFIFIQQKKEEEPEDSQRIVEINTGNEVQALYDSVGSDGGIVNISDHSDPLYGLKIEIPKAASSEEIDIFITHADIENIEGLPGEAYHVSKMIKISTHGSDSWNQFKSFDKPCKVTLPYNPNFVINEENIRFYYYDDKSKHLDSTGFISQDIKNNTITFYTGSFSKFIAIELSLSANVMLNVDYSVDTGFRPSNDGWFIQNTGSYLSPGGNSLGMTSYAKWYYSHKKIEIGEKLYTKYIEGDKDEWQDDYTAIQLATRCQMGTQGIMASLIQEEKDWAETYSHDVAYSIVHGLKVSGEPQLLGLMLQYQDGTGANGGHSVLVYQYNEGNFDIYDPNYPGTPPGTDDRQIPFSYNIGFIRKYSSGKNAGEGRQYNIFYHAGIKTFTPQNAYNGLYESAEKKFNDDSVFPTISLGYADSNGFDITDSDNNGIRDTSESKVIIGGVISDEQKDVTSIYIYINNKKFEAMIDPDNHQFFQEVPLCAGNNDIKILATDENIWSSWAGYKDDFIESTSSKTSLGILLTWDQYDSDIDLHVLEPTINGNPGRHIFFNNMGVETMDINPYLNIDNREGYGPECYIAKENMTLPNYEGIGKSVYGTYKFRAYYFKDNDSDTDITQPINWQITAIYLAFKDDISGEEFWVEKTWNGLLTNEDEEDFENFNNTGNAWSHIYTLEYNQPNPEDFNIPDPPQNQ